MGRRRPRRHNRVYHRARRRLEGMVERYTHAEVVDDTLESVDPPIVQLLMRLRQR